MKTVIASLLLLVLSGAARAEPYALGGFSFGGDALDTPPLTAGAGFRFTRNLAVEASYTDFNGIGHDSRSDDGTTLTTTERTWKAKGLGLAVVGSFPLSGSVSLVGRLGAQRLRGPVETTEKTFLMTVPATLTGTATTSNTESAWAPVFGIGLQDAVTPKVAVRVLLEHIPARKGFDALTMGSAALLYSF
jgi:hypothetical protein